MERPASRGSLSLTSAGVSKAPTGSAMQQPDRPNTASRLGGMAPTNRPPGTAAGKGVLGGPPQTAFKRVGVAAGSSLLTAPQVDARPLTQQGLGGQKPPSTASQGRQVLDRSYFLAALRQRHQELLRVTSDLQEELSTLGLQAQAFTRAQARQAELQKAVRGLQEQLADTNMVIDKAGSHAPLPSIQAEYMEVAGRNAAQQGRLEELLAERLALEGRSAQAEQKLAEMASSLDAQLTALGPAARQTYQQLTQEQAALVGEVAGYEDALGELDRQLAGAESELARHPYKQKALELQAQVAALSEQMLELSAAEARAAEPPEAQRTSLMASINRTNTELEQMGAAAKAKQEEVRRLEERAATAGAGASGKGAAPAQDDPQRREKYEELKTKERELAAFMDAFPAERSARSDQLEGLREGVTAALERLSKLSAISGGAMPNKGQFQEMQDELAYKKQQLQSAAATGEALKSELAARRAELDNLDSLGVKIQEELADIERQRGLLQADMDRYGRSSEIRREVQQQLSELGARQAALNGQRDAIKAKVQDLNWKQAAKTGQLKEHAGWSAISALQQQLETVSNQASSMAAALAAKEEECEYSSVQGEVGELVMGLNQLQMLATQQAAGL